MALDKAAYFAAMTTQEVIQYIQTKIDTITGEPLTGFCIRCKRDCTDKDRVYELDWHMCVLCLHEKSGSVCDA